MFRSFCMSARTNSALLCRVPAWFMRKGREEKGKKAQADRYEGREGGSGGGTKDGSRNTKAGRDPEIEGEHTHTGRGGEGAHTHTHTHRGRDTMDGWMDGWRQ